MQRPKSMVVSPKSRIRSLNRRWCGLGDGADGGGSGGRLRRIVAFIDEHEGSLTADEYGRLNALVFKAITTIQRLVESLDGNGADHWDIVLNQLSIDLGMDL